MSRRQDRAIRARRRWRRASVSATLALLLAATAGCSDDEGGRETGPDLAADGSDGGGDLAGDEGGTEAGAAGELRALLSASQVVPPIELAAVGRATLVVAADGSEIDVEIDAPTIAGAQGAFIRLGEVGVAGPVLFELVAGTFSNPLRRLLRPADLTPAGDVETFAAAVDALRAGRAYIEIPTDGNPGGELRGQVGAAAVRGTLSGGQRRPPVASDGQGTAVARLSPGQDAIEFEIDVSQLSDTTGANVRLGGVGNNGPLLFELATASFPNNLQRTVTAADLQQVTGRVEDFDDVVEALLSGRLYVEVSSTAHASGELRGQLGPAVVRAVLTAGQQAPPVAAAGTATATLRLTGKQDRIALRLDATGFSGATAVHLQLGEVGARGPIIFVVAGSSFSGLVDVTLDAGDLKQQAGEVESIADAIDAILSGRTYLNLRSDSEPTGALRGQIGPALLRCHLRGSLLEPQVASSASAEATVMLDGEQRELTVALDSGGLAGISSAGLHLGAVGSTGPELFVVSSSAFSGQLEVKLDAADLQTAPGIGEIAEAMVALLSGETYLLVRTAAHPTGELRGQVGPAWVTALVTGNQHAPPVAIAGTGVATLSLSGAQDAINVRLETSNVSDLSSARIYLGAVGEIGSPLFELASGGFSAPLLTSVGAAELQAAGQTDTMAEAVVAVLAGGTYLGITTTGNPDGALRGQIGTSRCAAAMLSGGQLEPAVTTGATGAATLVANGPKTEVTVRLEVSGLSGITGVRLHLGLPGESGAEAAVLADTDFSSPLVVALTAADVQPGTSIEDVIDASLSGAAYVVVSSAAHGNGEIRGQLGAVYFAAGMDGWEVVPQVTTAATGTAVAQLDGLQTHLRVTLTHENLAGISGAQLRHAEFGANGPLLFDLATSGFPSPYTTVVDATDIQGLPSFAAMTDAFIRGASYLLVTTSAHPGGEIRGQLR